VNFEFAAGRGDSLCEPRVRAKKTYIYIFNEIDLYHIQSYSPCLVFALHSGAIVVPFFLGAGTRNTELKVANVGKTVMEEFILSWVSLVRSILFFCFKWVWVNTYRYIFSGVNIHLPAILGFSRYQGFDPSPYYINMDILWIY
jgi:hypothetical protein